MTTTKLDMRTVNYDDWIKYCMYIYHHDEAENFYGFHVVAKILHEYCLVLLQALMHYGCLQKYSCK